MNLIPNPNPGGTNQTSPIASPIMKTGGQTPIIPGSPSTHPGDNPFIPMTMGSTIGTSPGAPTIPNAGGLTQSSDNTYGTTGAVDKQLKDIWGKGVGGALGNLLEGMSGTDSQVLQDYIKSLGPEFAQQAAGLSARLGAGGVSPNSSVNAIAQSNLSSQENALIAGESAKLTMSQEDLTAQLLMSMMPSASKEVATSGWSIFGNVMNQITGDIGNLMGGSYQAPQSGGTPGPAMSAPQLTSGGVDTSMDTGISQALSGQFPDTSMFPS